MTAFTQQFGKVAVLMGGISAEREVSLNSGAAVLAALLEAGVDAHKVDANPDNIGKLQDQDFDRAFVVLHGRWGEDGVVQGALQAINMPYTGSSVLGCALAMDKVRSKQIWQTVGLPTAKYRVIKGESDLAGIIDELGLPLFLKPAREGSSVGIGKVDREENLLSTWQAAAKVGDDVLAEQFNDGAELTVTILDGQPLPVIEMISANDFYDYEAKYQSDDTRYICPAELDAKLVQQVQSIALQAFQSLDCAGWGRVDVMLTAEQKPMLLEVNTVPGMTDHSLVPMAAAAAGMDFQALVLAILEQTL
ncbi:MAG: D-alanine--D-alanine ligase [Acidiferrobacterales bacterium]|nr:D-alanine--D-alanine ligase [Acidiferrobacterales bacterium]